MIFFGIKGKFSNSDNNEDVPYYLFKLHIYYQPYRKNRIEVKDMKATFERSSLLNALVTASKISQTKNNGAVVDGILMECPPDKRFGAYNNENENLCRISAFDLEKGVRLTFECDITEKGSCVLNTKRILDIVSKLPDGEILFETDQNNKMVVKGGNSVFELAVTSVEEFPAMPDFDGEDTITLPQYVLKEMLGETLVAVAKNSQREYFNGALFKIRDGKFSITGCDSTRVAVAEKIITGREDITAIIPGSFLNDLYSIISDSEDDIRMIINDKDAIFNIGEMYFFTRKIEDQYIEIEKFIPKTYTTQAFMSRKEFLDALERAILVAADKLGVNGKPFLKLEFSGRSIRLSAVSSVGTIDERISASVEGNDITIGFNCKFLLDIIRTIPDRFETIKIKLNKPLIGVVIEPAEGRQVIKTTPDSTVFAERVVEENTDNDEDIGLLYFVMPVKMNQ